MISKDEIIKLAKLSKLSFNEEELENFQNDLSNTLDYIDQLNELKTDDVEPLYNVLEMNSRLNKHSVKEEMNKKDFLESSPKADSNFVIVPKIVGDSNE